MEKVHTHKAHAGWDKVGTTVIAHLLKRFLETLPVAVVPSALFDSMLHGSEARLAEWLHGKAETFPTQDGKTINNCNQHRVALKSLLGLIIIIAKRSMANHIAQMRAEAMKGDVPTAELHNFLGKYSVFSRQAASFFAPGLLRPASEDDVVCERVWRKAATYPAEVSFSGFYDPPTPRSRPPPPSEAFIAWAVGSSRNRANWQLTILKRMRNVLRLITSLSLKRCKAEDLASAFVKNIEFIRVSKQPVGSKMARRAANIPRGDGRKPFIEVGSFLGSHANHN